MTEQLNDDDMRIVRSLRRDNEMTYQQIAEQLDVDSASAFRLLKKPDYRFDELTIIRMQKAIQRIRDKRAEAAKEAAKATRRTGTRG